jgi:uncharacterized protein DUF6059
LNGLNRYLVQTMVAVGRYLWSDLRYFGSLELGFWPLPQSSPAEPARPAGRTVPGPPPGHPERLVPSTAQAPVEGALRDLIEFLDELDGRQKLDRP